MSNNSQNTIKSFGYILMLAGMGILILLLIKNWGPGNDHNSDKDEYSQIIRRGKVNIGFQNQAPPFNDVEDGKPVGFDYELAKLLFSQREFGFISANSIVREYQSLTYDGIPELLFDKNNRGEYMVDIVMGGLTFSDEDLEGVVYSIPYIEDFGYSLVAKKSEDYSGISDLRSKKIGCVSGDPDVLGFITRIKPKGAEIVELPDEENTWMSDAINSNQVDVIIYDFPFAVVEIDNMDEPNIEVKIAKILGSELAYKIGVREGNDKLLSELNSAIRKVKELPAYGDLIRKYLPTGPVRDPIIEASDIVYLIKTGDTLSKIASECLGEVERFEELAQLNNIGQPDLIFPGQKLKMPKNSNCRY